MVYAFESVSVQTILYLLIGVTISKAHYSDGQYSDYENWHSAVQKYRHNRESKVRLTIFYETHCPYTIRFFKEQLAPTVEQLASHLDVYMIPYGHAKTNYKDGQYIFQCQHGDIECYGNKLHACAIDVIDSNALAALFNICIIGKTYDYNALNDLVFSCARKLNIPTSDLWQCVHSDWSSHLLKNYGDVTRLLRPPHIPYVIMNGSDEDQEVITKHLGYSICRLLVPQPPICRTK